MGISAEELTHIVQSLHEVNPMMGHRGCRLCITYPEIAVMQTNAIIKAAIAVSKETGEIITPFIMIPLTCEVKEFRFVKNIVVSTADELIKNAGIDMKYKVGTMTVSYTHLQAVARCASVQYALHLQKGGERQQEVIKL